MIYFEENIKNNWSPIWVNLKRILKHQKIIFNCLCFSSLEIINDRGPEELSGILQLQSPRTKS